MNLQDALLPGKLDAYRVVVLAAATALDDAALPAVLRAYTAKGGEYISNVGLTGHFEGTNHHGNPIVLDTTRQLAAGEVVDLTADIQPNYEFFKSGPGYSSKDQDTGL